MIKLFITMLYYTTDKAGADLVYNMMMILIFDYIFSELVIHGPIKNWTVLNRLL